MENRSELEIFNQLFAKYHKPFIRFANSYVRDTAVAEDFTVEALMGYWENRHTLTPNTNPAAYVLTTLKNKCLNHLQHLQTKQEVSERIKEQYDKELAIQITVLKACDPNELFSNEVQQIVRETLQKLPAKTRAIFQMSRDQNLSHTEISQRTDLTEKSVEYHIGKALKNLRVALRDYMSVLVFFY